MICGVVITGLVSVLLVSVCLPVNVATVLSIATVDLLEAALVSIPVPPVSVSVSLSRSMAIVQLSVAKSKSSADS